MQAHWCAAGTKASMIALTRANQPQQNNQNKRNLNGGKEASDAAALMMEHAFNQVRKPPRLSWVEAVPDPSHEQQGPF